MSEVDSSAPVETYNETIFGEVEAQIDALQEIAAELNGKIRPEITIRMRPNLSWWLGCQCGTKFVSGSGASFCEAHHAFRAALDAARVEAGTK